MVHVNIVRTIDFARPETLTFLAEVQCSALVAVITSCGVVGEHAPNPWGATIVGADIVVITDQLLAGLALAI
jgi:hypothetical protein